LQMSLALSKEEFTGKKASNTDWSYGAHTLNFYLHYWYLHENKKFFPN
jgi:hypothetical protein